VEGTAVLGRLTWLAATVVGTREETAKVRTLELEAPGWTGHRAGQHLDVRLTSEDGYQAERSYSIASAPGEPLAITVEVLEDGEVSPYLVDEVREGDEFELRGPIGGYFVWDGDEPEPVLLIGGGSGVVPLAAIARQRARSGSTAPMKLLYSSRSWDDVIYRDELGTLGVDVVYTLTRSQPPDWTGYSRRIDDELLKEVAYPHDQMPRVYVCGSTRFVDAGADGLVRLGYDPRWIRTERFGATG
jgi:ferredoxin-NADP reductase